MREGSSKDEWVSVQQFAKKLTYSLKMFFQEEGDRVCLNVIKDFSNIGKFYASKVQFSLAYKNKETIVMVEEGGKTFEVEPAICNSFNISVLKRDLLNIAN